MVATLTPNENFNVFFTLTKVDEAKRLVYGRATQEVPDGVREIMDYKSSKPFFEKWSQAAKDRTKAAVDAFGSGAQSLGNIRIQHSEEIGGKVIDIAFNDTEKAVDIGTFCGNDEAWGMIKAGLLTGFSVGGSYVKRWPDDHNPTFWRYTANPAEVSYVDSPAVPTAKYTFIKSDGTEELRKAIHPSGWDYAMISGQVYFRKSADSLWITKGEFEKQMTLSADLPQQDNPSKDVWLQNAISNPSAPILASSEDSMVVKDVPGAGGVLSPNLIDTHAVQTLPNDPVQLPKPYDHVIKDNAEMISSIVNAANKFSEAVSKYAEIKKTETDEKLQKETKLKSIGARVNIKRREGAPLTPPNGLPDDPNLYADPANYSFSCVAKADTLGSLSAYQHRNGVEKYSPTEWSTLGIRLAVKATKLFGVRYKFDPKTKNISRNEAKKMALTKANAQAIVQQLASAMGVAADQISDDPQAIADLIMAAMGTVDPAGSDPASSTPSAPTGSQADASVASLKATGVSPALSGQSTQSITPSSPSSPSTTDTTGVTTSPLASAATPTTMTQAAPVIVPSAFTSSPSGSSSDSSSGTSSSSSLPSMDKDAQIKVLSESIAKILEALGINKDNTQLAVPAAQPAPVLKSANGNIPLADLARLVNAQAPEQNPVMAALTKVTVINDGLEIPDRNALQKAAEAAGTKDHPDETAARSLAMQEVYGPLAQSGIFSEYWSKGGIFAPPAVEEGAK